MGDNNPINWQLGKYQVQEEIGRGGMGTVYRGYDPLLDRYAAIKVLAPHLVWERDFVDRFMREARIAARLNHPVVVKIYEVGQEAEWYYLVMEYIEGQTVNELVQQQGALSATEALAILHPLAEALDYAHQQGLVHRDIKPENIIVSPSGSVKITDFGMARAIQQTRLTTPGIILGTPQYMSPEQADGQNVDARSDQYSLAVVAYEMLSGQVPFQADTSISLMFKVIHEPPAPICQVRPELPKAVEVVLERALAKKPDQRFETTSAFVQALEEALTARKKGAVRAASAAKAAPTGRRMPRWGWALGGLAVLALIVGLAVIMMSRNKGNSTDTASAEETTVPAIVMVTASATPTLSPTATPSPAPSATPSATPPPTPSATPSAAPSATPSPLPTTTTLPSLTPTSAAAAVVLTDGVELRPGATTWWYADQTLPAQTELELVGYDPNFADWVYVQTTDGTVQGWAQVKDLQIFRELSDLPLVTPHPTLTPTPAVAQPSPPATCEGGVLRLDAWPVDKACVAGGWEATIFVEGHGGDCIYTYAWDGETKAGPMPGSTTFKVSIAGAAAIIGNASVTSADQTAEQGLLIPPPDCAP